MTFAAADISAATQALCIAALEGEEIDAEIGNFLSSYDFALSRDHPGKLWWHADAHHPAIARALKVDRAEYAAAYALAPFRLGRIDEKPVILAALPCPHFFAPADIDWLRIETVLAWEPHTDMVTILGGPEAALIGHIRPAAAASTIHGRPFTFFRAIVEQRAQFAVGRGKATAWSIPQQEIDETPGLLLIGHPGKARWPIGSLPRDLTCVDCDAAAVNHAILRQAGIPRAHASSGLRRAA